MSYNFAKSIIIEDSRKDAYLEGLTLGLLPPTEFTDEAGGVGNPLLLNTTLGGSGLSVFKKRFVVVVVVCKFWKRFIIWDKLYV